MEEKEEHQQIHSRHFVCPQKEWCIQVHLRLPSAGHLSAFVFHGSYIQLMHLLKLFTKNVDK